MKKIILGIASIAITSILSAQSFGVQVGGNMASQSVKADESDVSISLQSKTGFIIGVLTEVPIANSLNFRPELNFIQKGSKLNVPGVVETKTSLNYLEIPLNVTYNHPAGTGHVFFGAGPSIGIGLSGKTTGKDLEENVELSSDVKFDGKKDANDDNAHLKRMDFGASVFGGYKFANGLFANIGYAFGLSNISPEEGGSFKNKGTFLKVGFIFGGGNSKK
ncbi:MAG: porin family protein [Ferruginibacter sp.]